MDGSYRIVLFHSAFGLRSGVQEWAEHLRSAGHVVDVPDLYGGLVLDTVDEAVQARDRLGGLEGLKARAGRALQGLPHAVVYAGFSIGAELAHFMTLKRPGALGAVLMHGVLPAADWDHAEWPSRVPVQVHFAEGDSFRIPADLEALIRAAGLSEARCDLQLYPGSGHLFADPDLADFHDEAATAMTTNVLSFLAQVGLT